MKGSEYHEITAYQRSGLASGGRIRGGTPSFFKTYPTLPFYQLPKTPELPSCSLGDVLTGATTLASNELNLSLLSIFFALTYGITATDRTGIYSFRAVPSAGALYPCEVYAWLGGFRDLPHGLYHYNVARHGLEQIATVDSNDAFFEAWITAIPYRSAWKYRDRAFRYVLLDSGHIFEQALVSAKVSGITNKFKEANWTGTYGCRSETAICQRLAVDPHHERPVACVAFAPLSETAKIDYLTDKKELLSASAPANGADYGPVILNAINGTIGEVTIPITPDISEKLPSLLFQNNAVQVILNRRSRRNFIKGSISADYFESYPKAFSRALPIKGLTVYFVVERVDNYDEGVYELWFDGTRPNLKLTGKGMFMSQLADACLHQMWVSHASFAIVVLLNTEELEKTYGNAGYRVGMLCVGRIGQLCYLLSEALGLGCCGVGAFYDYEVTRVIGLHSGMSAYVLAVGPVKKQVR